MAEDRTRRESPTGDGDHTRREDVGGLGDRTRRESPAGDGPSAGGLLPDEVMEAFRVERLLAQGAEANTALVRRSADDQPRVVKAYRQDVPVKPELLDRLVGWGEDAERDTHLVGVEAFAVGTNALMRDGRQWYEIQEYCSVGSLRDLTEGDEGPRLAPDLVHEVVRQLAAALGWFHRMVGAHRDLKPDNILVREHPPLNVVLGDFNLAVLDVGSLAIVSRSATVSYGAPELIAKGEASPAIDYWSLGVMVHELSTGQRPLHDLPDEAARINAVANGWVVDPADIDDDRLQHLCAGLTTVEAQHRWGHEQVRAWLAGDMPEVVAEEPAAQAPAPAPPVSQQQQTLARPYSLGDHTCRTLEEFTRCATVDARHWYLARKGLKGGYVQSWLRNNEADQNLMIAIDDLVATYAPHNANVALLHLIGLLDPTLPPTYRGYDASPAGLDGLAHDARNGDEDARETIAELVDHHLLPALTGADDQRQDLQRLHGEWMDHLHAFDRLLASLSAYLPDIVPELPARAREVFLHCLTYPEADSYLRQHAAGVRTPKGQQQPWFDNLGNPATASLPNTFAISVFAADADTQTERQQQAQKEAEEQRRQDEKRREQQQRRDQAISEQSRRSSRKNVLNDVPYTILQFLGLFGGLNFMIATGLISAVRDGDGSGIWTRMTVVGILGLGVMAATVVDDVRKERNVVTLDFDEPAGALFGWMLGWIILGPGGEPATGAALGTMIGIVIDRTRAVRRLDA